MSEGKFLGKYRGTVVMNIDPKGQGRLQVQSADANKLFPTSWAMPNVPIAGLQMGLFVIPPIGAGVWVEFEQGNRDYPIWCGCWWGSVAEVPALAKLATPGVPVTVLQTQVTQSALVMSDTPVPPMIAGGILLKSGASYITIDPTGVTIQAPKIQINGLTIVNNGALTVTL
jgi:hypothetical protein